jgi:tetratricopeptide (TPR) repeat protein
MDQVDTDKEFLRNLEKTCATADDEYAARTKGRLAEMEAVADTIAYLNSDASFDAFDKTSNEEFLQISSMSSSDKRRRAAEVLRKSGNAQLAMLASQVQLDAFTKVKEAIDSMVVELGKQQKDEVEHRDYCVAEMNTNERETAKMYDTKTNLETTIADTKKTVEELTADIEEKTKAIEQMNVDMKKASEVREAENAEFQTVVADQRATQVILKKALARLEDFYKKGKGNKMVFVEQEPPVKFNNYKQNAGASPVMGLIEQIIEDSKKLVAEATEAEYKAQKEYEKFVTDSNAIIKQLSEDVDAKTKATATAKGESAESKGDLENAIGELESLAEYDADLHGECDFVLKNFDIRQKARLQEMEAIQAAKGILSGAK